jgi:hypothetical protein
VLMIKVFREIIVMSYSKYLLMFELVQIIMHTNQKVKVMTFQGVFWRLLLNVK